MNAELISGWGAATGGGERAGGETGAAVIGGEDSPKRSLESDADEGGFALGGGGDWKLENPKSLLLDDIDVVRDCGFAGGAVGDVRLSNKPPPALPIEAVGDVTLGAAGADLELAKLVRPAKGDGFSAGFLAGGEVGKLSPLKASVKLPRLDEDVDCGGGEARSPNEEVRSCAVGCGLE